MTDTTPGNSAAEADTSLQHPPLGVRISRKIQSSWKTVVVFLPYAWLLIFFLLPFVIVAKISVAEALIASPPFSSLIEWTDEGILTIRIVIDNFSYIFEDDLYVKTYLNSVKI